MPTEHEYKYVLSMNLLEETNEVVLKNKCNRHLEIEQGYLAYSKGYSSRIRSVTESGKTKWFYTLKQKVADRVVEIEKKLDERDGNDLWAYCIGKLKKDRYVFKKFGTEWELDLFKYNGEVYFIMLEVELEENMPRPKTLPDFIKNYVLHEVDLSDDRFSNKRLGDVNYSKCIYKNFK